MAIKQISGKNIGLHKQSKIPFYNSNIAILVGQNGTGKTQLLKNFRKGIALTNYVSDEQSRVDVMIGGDKETINEISKVILELFPTTDKKLIEKIENVKGVEDNLRKYDETLWNLFDDAIIKYSFNLIYDKNRHNDIISAFNDYNKDKYFWNSDFNQLSSIISEPVISGAIANRINKLTELCNLIKKKLMWKSVYIDLNTAKPIFTGTFQRSSVNQANIATNLWSTEPFKFLRSLLSVSKTNLLSFSAGFYEKTQDDLDSLSTKMKESLSTFLRQPNIEINIDISHNNFNVSFVNKFDDGVIEFDNLSTGTKFMLKLLNETAIEMNQNTLILIDEPENGLHPIMQQILIGEFEDITRKYKCRFLISTHSPYIANTSFNGEVLVSYRNSEDEILLNTKKEFTQRNKFVDISEMQVWEHIGHCNPFVDIKDTDILKKILICEGESDVVILRAILKKLGLNIIDEYIIRHSVGSGGHSRLVQTAKMYEHLHGLKREKILIVADKDIDYSKDNLELMKKNIPDFKSNSSHQKTYDDLIKYEYDYTFIGELNKSIESWVSEKEIKKTGKANQKIKDAYEFAHNLSKESRNLSSETMKNFDEFIKLIS